MQIDPLPAAEVAAAVDRVAAALGGPAVAAFRRITADPLRQLAKPCDTAAHRAAALDLVRNLGIGLIDAEPAAAFSWDGAAIRGRSEASVLLHEIAHWQLCPAERLDRPDFGLGAGPETGRKAEADAARAVDDAGEVQEEQRASLLGILWEAHLGQPAIHAFLEQNWLEGWRRGAAALHFADVLGDLARLGLTTADGVPLPRSIRS